MLCLTFLLGSLTNVHAQQKGIYRQYLPINTHAQMSYLSKGKDKENIIFDAQPIVRYHFYNNFKKNNDRVEDRARAYYVSFRPHLRMYDSQSNPVRTPSYKIALGFQWSKLFNYSKLKGNQLAVSLESGHYSNGQPNCFLSQDVLDGVMECDELYNNIRNNEPFSDMINRESGNFSTNWTEFIVQYRRIFTDEEEDYIENRGHTVRLGYTYYHNRFLGLLGFGGYSENDIGLYGEHFWEFQYEYLSYFKVGDHSVDFELSQNFNYVTNADPRIPELRSVTKFVVFPFSSDLGFFVAGIFGRDNYNIRFVDKVSQFQIGLTWTGRMKISLDKDEDEDED